MPPFAQEWVQHGPPHPPVVKEGVTIAPSPQGGNGVTHVLCLPSAQEGVTQVPLLRPFIGDIEVMFLLGQMFFVVSRLLSGLNVPLRSSHGLTVCGFDPWVGFCADSSECVVCF